MLGAAPFPAPFWAIVRTPTNGQAKTGSASTDARQPFVLASGVRSETLGVPTFCRPSAPRRVSAHMLAAGALLDALLSIEHVSDALEGGAGPMDAVGGPCSVTSRRNGFSCRGFTPLSRADLVN